MTIGYQVGLGDSARVLVACACVRTGASGFLRTLDFGTVSPGVAPRDVHRAPSFTG